MAAEPNLAEISLFLEDFWGHCVCGEPKVGRNRSLCYLLFNFNDYPSGMVTLFNLLVMGNWQIWMESYEHLTGSSWSLIYFISFYLISVLLLLNLIVAFVLEAFFAEMELEKAGEADLQGFLSPRKKQTTICACEDKGYDG
ncbi:hypothetical protein ACP70R_037010 [Stipagrostis hirtigluma subsp. patula]